MERYILKKQNDSYVIIDRFPVWASGKHEVVIEQFSDDEYDIAKETLDIYIDENKKSRQLDRQKGDTS